MAGRTDREVSDLQAVLSGHTGVLNAIRQDQHDQGRTIARLEAETRREFADVRAEMRHGFGTLAKGQEVITQLLNQHLGTPDEESGTGDTGE